MSINLKPAGGESLCFGGNCPTLYESEDGRYFIQGRVVSDEVRQSVTLSPGEELIEINRELLDSMKSAL